MTITADRGGEIDRRTLRSTDPIVGDAPIGHHFDGQWDWDIWATKKGRLVARHTFEDGNGYQVEANTMSFLMRDIRGLLTQLKTLNDSLSTPQPNVDEGDGK